MGAYCELADAYLVLSMAQLVHAWFTGYLKKCPSDASRKLR